MSVIDVAINPIHQELVFEEKDGKVVIKMKIIDKDEKEKDNGKTHS